jgi:long-chain acyl-CoA synthetase
MNVALWLKSTAQTRPTAPALLDGTAIVANYDQFAAHAASIATGLRHGHNVAPGDRVAVFMPNRTEYLECLYGIWWAGAVAVPVNSKLHSREAAWIIQHSETKLVFVTGKSAASLMEAELPDSVVLLDVDAAAFQDLRTGHSADSPASRDTHELAWLFYTSGTTGRPKGAMLSHGNLVAMSLSYLADVDTVTADDAALYAAPMSHGSGLYNFIHVRQGARHVVPPSRGFDPAEILALSRTLMNVSMFAAPTMVRRLVEHAQTSGETGDGIKTIVYGGGPMYLADIKNALSVLGPRFVQIYGQGESPMTITALGREWHQGSCDPRRLGSVGQAQSVVDVRITNGDGNSLPAGSDGEIEVRGLTVMSGYWRDAEATAKTVRNGWLRTGDVGRLDADGFLTLTDRSKDVIISGGSNIYPREVEEVLLQHPAIQEASVIGAPDPEWGEIVIAFIVMRPGLDVTDDSLDAHCISSIARFKRPKRYIRVTELPKNSYGKVLKTALREMIALKSTSTHR